MPHKKTSRAMPAASQRTLALVMRVVGGLSLVVLAALVGLDFLRQRPLSLESFFTLPLALAALAGYLMARAGRTVEAVSLLIAAMAVCAVGASAVYGSLRAAGAMGFGVAVVLAGSFLPFRGLALTWAACTGVMLSFMLVGPWLGWVQRTRFEDYLHFWITLAAAMIGIGAILYSNRRQMAATRAQHMRELQGHSQLQQDMGLTLQRFDRVFQMMPAPMMVQAGWTGLILDVNAAFERTLGYSRSYLVGSDDHLLWANAIDVLTWRGLPIGQCQRRPVRVRSADGQVLDLLLSCDGDAQDEGRMVFVLEWPDAQA